MKLSLPEVDIPYRKSDYTHWKSNREWCWVVTTRHESTQLVPSKSRLDKLYQGKEWGEGSEMSSSRDDSTRVDTTRSFKKSTRLMIPRDRIEGRALKCRRVVTTRHESTRLVPSRSRLHSWYVLAKRVCRQKKTMHANKTRRTHEMYTSFY